MKLPDTSLYTIIQLVMGGAMGMAGVALLFGVFTINTIPDKAMIAVLAICIAGKYLMDGLTLMMSAMNTNVEQDELEITEIIKEMVH